MSNDKAEKALEINTIIGAISIVVTLIGIALTVYSLL